MQDTNRKHVAMIVTPVVLLGALALFGLGKGETRPAVADIARGVVGETEPAGMVPPVDSDVEGQRAEVDPASAPWVISGLENGSAIQDEETTDDLPRAGQPVLILSGADISISDMTSADFYSLRFPLLAPTKEQDREFFIFGVDRGEEPTLLSVHVHQLADPKDLPILLDVNILMRHEQIVVTAPKWNKEEPRILASLVMTESASTLTCPKDAEQPCEVVDYSNVDIDGYMVRKYHSLQPGASIDVPPEHATLLSILSDR